MKISERIKEIRKGKNLTQKQLGKATGFTQQAIAYWEKGIYQPTADAIIALAIFFEVSSDYLLGLEREDGSKTYDQRSYGNKGEITYNNK
jgi:repressor LexA